MARAFQQSQLVSDDDHSPSEWTSLRQELVTLLDQVDSRVARSRTPGYNETTQDQRHQAVEDENARHRDALRTVQRAITRFEETPQPLPAMPPNPRDSLQAAINQIRSRQDNQARPAPAPAPRQQTVRVPEPQQAPQPPAQPPLFDKLATSVNGLSGRLERLEGEIKAQLKAGANIKDVADQVAQLAHVVELLAGAVGETGQVKRLEGQIASLGKIMSQGREMDIQTLTRRLDDVAATVGKLAELQVHYADKVQNPVESQAFQDGMRSIEQSVRAVYDRIDTLERTAALPPAELEHVTQEMARLTEALQDGAREPLHLVELVDALNSRISEIESGDRILHGLRKDLGALRDTIVVSLTPRFEAIEQQIETLAGTVGTRADMAEISRQVGALGERIADRPIDPGIGQLEAQVRQLVARMDQTGEQLSGLAKLYATEPAAIQPDYDAISDMVAIKTLEAVQQHGTPAQPDYDAISNMVAIKTLDAVQQLGMTSQPDFDALSDMVALKTFEAVQRHNPPPDSSLTDTIANLENRIATMLGSMQRDPEVDAFDGMQAGIAEVNERLKRLEDSLVTQSFAQGSPVPRADMAAIIREAESAAPMAAMPRPRADSMPRDPVAEAPLTAPAFPEPVGPVAKALDAKNGPRKRHPGLDDDISLASRYESVESAPVGFAPENIAPPPAPQPSAGFLDVRPTEPAPMPVATMAPEPMAATVMPSKNTFIEAHRRAALRQQQQTGATTKPEVSSNSLIGRALARFQTNGEAQPKTEKAKRALAGDKPARVATPEPVMPVLQAEAAAPTPVPSLEPQIAVDGPQAKPAPKESFLLRNRKVILMAAAVVALVFLTANLVAQRLEQSEDTAALPPADPVPVTTGDISNDVAAPNTGAPVLAQPAGPRVIPLVDSLKTGSIDKSAAQGFTSSPDQAMPTAFAAATDLANASPAADPLTPSPVKVEAPPDGVGPADLRQAAANGDARAQFEVAAIFTEGRAVTQDYKAAATWYERSAAQGFAPAQYRLGSLYEQGQGVTKDLNTAKLWYERAAEAGNRMSMHNLAALYAGGQLGKQEFESAAKWFEEAANRGMTDSQFNLGMLYARGLGVPQSMADSFKWFGIAALNGDKDSIKARDDIARSLDADTVAKVTAEINAFKPAAVDLAANFAPIGTWTKTFDPGETITTRDIVTSVQKALKKLGYDVGTPDGVAGAKTSVAIKSFEKATGMSEVGQINPRLLAVLGSQPV